jgi:hypothetical protein
VRFHSQGGTKVPARDDGASADQVQCHGRGVQQRFLGGPAQLLVGSPRRQGRLARRRRAWDPGGMRAGGGVPTRR